MLASLLLLAAAASPAPITGTEDARQICLATRPVDRFEGGAEEREGFERRRRTLLKEKRLAVIPLAQLQPGDPDEEARRVVLLRGEALETREGVKVFTEQSTFELDAGEGVPSGEHGVARMVAALRAGGKAALRLTYDLVDLDGSGPCPTGARPGSRPVLAVRALEIELVDGEGRVVARGRGSDAPEGRRAAGGKPAVEVAPATVSGRGPLASLVTSKAQERVPALLACFEAALARDDTLDGALVFQVDIDAAGKGRRIVVSADTVQDEELVACARKTLEPVSWGKGGPSVALVPVHFERR